MLLSIIWHAYESVSLIIQIDITDGNWNTVRLHSVFFPFRQTSASLTVAICQFGTSSNNNNNNKCYITYLYTSIIDSQKLSAAANLKMTEATTNIYNWV